MLKVCDDQIMSIDSLDFDYVRQLVKKHCAVALDAGKQYLADLHLGTVAEQAGFDNIAQLIEHLKCTPFGSQHLQVIESLLNYETTFFRDNYPFETLKNIILPELIQRKPASSLNIWSAACSSGQEPYTIAMLIKEYFPTLDKTYLQIIASDFSSKALARAKKGVYSQLEIRRGLPATLQKKYFRPNGNQWHISSDIQDMIDFRQVNLIESWQTLPKMDVIFLRNVLIYFNTDTKKQLLNKVKQQLSPYGYLFLGGGETTINLDEDFERLQLGKAICYRLHS